MNLVVIVVLAVLALGYTGWFAASAWRVPARGSDARGSDARGSGLAAKSRIDLVTAGVDAVLLLILVHELAPWVTSPMPLWLGLAWFIPVVFAAIGVVGAVLRWNLLPTTRPDRSPRRAWTWAVVHWAVAALIVVFLLWPR